MRLSSTILSAILTTSTYAGPKAAGGDAERFPPSAPRITSTTGVESEPRVSSAAVRNQLYSQFLILDRKHIALKEGIRMLEETRIELVGSQDSMQFWGRTAIISNTILIPLNVIVNSLELKQANTLLKALYQELAKVIYEKFAGSGTRVDGKMKSILANLKKAIVEELKRKGLREYIPGANIILGLAEDSVALYQSMDMVNKGAGEASHQNFMIDKQVTRMKRELLKLGIERAELLRRAAIHSRIA